MRRHFNMLFRIVNCFLFKRCIQSIYFHPENKKLITEISKTILSRVSEVLIGAKICCASIVPKEKLKMDIDEVQKALNEGDIAVLKLLDELKDFVKVVSEEYRNCLRKQMEITEKSKNVGHFSEMWDELPEYRTLANELRQQLYNYNALFETLGKMAEMQFSNGIEKDGSLVVKINEQFLESQEIIKKEFEENKKLEMELLKLNCDTILMDITNSSEN